MSTEPSRNTVNGHALVRRGLFQTRRLWTKWTLPADLPGVSVLLVTWNRSKFLDLALRALAETLPADHEVLLWDNASRDETHAVANLWLQSSLNLRYFRSDKNIGTNGFAALALHAKRQILFEMDDDVLVLPRGWSERLAAAFKAFPECSYLALDVVQDDYTNGAKPLPSHYTRETRGTTTIEFGPTGGWGTATPRHFYFSTEGFPFRPHKPYFPEDGYYNRIVRDSGKRAGILSGVRAYHASGPNWNAAFGYGTMLTQKLGSREAAKSSAMSFPEVSSQVPDPSVLEAYRALVCPTQ